MGSQALLNQKPYSTLLSGTIEHRLQGEVTFNLYFNYHRDIG